MDDFPEYAARFLRIRTKEQGVHPLLLNVAQNKVQAAIQNCLNARRPPRIVELKARQTGLTTDGLGRQFHLCHVRRDRNAILMAHTEPSARKIFRIARTYFERLPQDVKPETDYLTKSEIVFEHNRSSLQVAVADEGGGRGMTAQYVHLSEASRYRDFPGVFDAVMHAVPDIMDSLVIVESTAAGMNDFHELWVNAKTGANDFVPVFVPWFDEPGYTMTAWFGEEDLDEEEKELRGKHMLSLGQLAWRRWNIRNKCRGSVRAFKQENPSTDTEAFLVSGDKVFTEESIQWHNQNVPPGTDEFPIELSSLPPTIDIEWDLEKDLPALRPPHEGGPLRIYREPVPRFRYIIGVDPSEGDPGSDPSPMAVLNQMTLKIDAVWWGRRRPDMLAHTARALCAYFNKARCIWEANNHGLPFGLEFVKLYDNFHWRETSPDSVARKVSDKPGYSTNVRTKPLLWNTLVTYVDKRIVIPDPQFVSELSNVYYEQGVGGRRLIKKHEGKTMDLLVAAALALEDHRGGDPEVDLIPLEADQVDALRTIREERRVAFNMGLPYAVEEKLDRTGMTAKDLEDLDEEDYVRTRRRQRMGLMESI